LIPVTGPGALDDPVRVLPAYLDRPVRAERIYHDDLVAPGETPEATADVVFFIEADDDRGNLRLGIAHDWNWRLFFLLT
jgi:hypothetical protein